MKPVLSLSDIPREPHYVIVNIESIHVPGDERSKTDPGHGYPASTHKYTEMWVTTSREEWENEILNNHNSKKEIVAYHVDMVANYLVRQTVCFS